jgi:hypothetical protein
MEQDTRNLIKTLREKMVKGYVNQLTDKSRLKRLIASAERQGQHIPLFVKKMTEDIKEEE